jgi:hypothetical protein
MLAPGDVISESEKRRALELALNSKVFARSSQLRNFLRYVCEAEIEGRAEDLKEYALGVSALGRSPDYSPSADSCVRTRAYELRNKLRLLYELEAEKVSIQIEIRKGGYAPQFVRTGNAVATPEPPVAPPAPELPASPIAVPIALPSRPVWWPLLAASLLAGSLLTLLAVRLFSPPSREARAADMAASPELSMFWKPFLDSGVPLLVSYDTRLFLQAEPSGLIVRDAQSNQMSDVPSSATLNHLRQQMGFTGLSEVRDYADAGAVNAIFLLTQMLTARQRPVALKRSLALGWDDIWNSNVVFVGRPNLHPGVKFALEGGDFVDTIDRIRNLHPRAGELPEYVAGGSHGGGEKFALISEFPGPQPGHHMLILGGAGSEYGWALAEYVTNPSHVADLISHLRTPSGALPEAFQVLIQATFESNVPIRIRYVTHHPLAVVGRTRTGHTETRP